MDLPIKFPTDAEVIAEEAARQRLLSASEVVAMIRGMCATGFYLMDHCDNPIFARAYTEEQEANGIRRVREFIARHATPT